MGQADSTPLQAKPQAVGSGSIGSHRLDVNQFRWKTIWTAILGYSVSTFPVLFLIPHFPQHYKWNNFLTPHAVS
ncbi:MAG TPA: hypothetical protein DEO73_16520 [Pantoea sp.]|nr:hypothetical protein [Pantoea sp.]